MLDFIVVEANSPYQMIFRQLFMRVSLCVMSTHYLALKYRVNGMVGVVKGDQRMAKSCYELQRRPYKLLRSIVGGTPRRVSRSQFKPGSKGQAGKVLTISLRCICLVARRYAEN